MRTYSIIFGLILLVITSDVLASRHCTTHRRLTTAEHLATLSPDIDLDLLKLTFFPGGSLVAGYEYEVEPAYTQGLYSRQDRWIISTKFIPEDMYGLNQDRIDFKVFGGLNNKTEATFIRFFKDPCEAMLSNPYSPRRIPLTTQVALSDKFKPGDYFLFRGEVGFVVGGDLLSLMGTSSWATGLNGSYLMNGYYQLHIVRQDDTHLRLKVIAHRGKNLSGTFGLGYEDQFDVFGVRALDKSLEKFVNTKPIKIKAHAASNKVFLIDYVMDLSDPEVSSAFEAIIRKVKDFRNIELAAPWRDEPDLEANVLLDLTPLEEIYKSDLEAGNISRLKRNLRTSSRQTSHGLGLHLGNKVIGFNIVRGGATAHMNVRQTEETSDKYILRSWDNNWDGRFLYSLMRSKKEESLRALFTADDSFTIAQPVSIIKNISHKKNKFTYSDLKSMKKTFLKLLPKVLYDEIPWDSWNQRKGERHYNFGMRFQLFLSPESILEAPELTREEIKVFFKDFLKYQGLTIQDYFKDQPNGRSAAERFRLSLNEFANDMEKALDRDRTPEERLDRITDLRYNTLFRNSGLGFFMYLRPDKIRSWYHVDLDISSNESSISYKRGDGQLSTIYKKILTIKAALDDEGLDIIREAESIALPHADEEEHTEEEEAS